MRPMRLFWLCLVLEACTCGPGVGCGGDVGVDRCVPKTCEALAATCGGADDGCGGTLRCGACAPSELCGAKQPNTCGRVCTADGWCWEYPLPHGFDIKGVWESGPDDVWVIADNRLLVHFDGQSWSKVEVEAGGTFESISGSGPQDVWIAAGELLHYTGGRFLATPKQDSKLYYFVDGSNVSAVYAISLDGAGFARWDGASWQPLESPGGYIVDFKVFGRDEVWAVAPPVAGTSERGVMRFDGRHWRPVQLPGSNLSISSIAGSSSADVWAVGRDFSAYPRVTRVVLHWDGVAWSDRRAGLETVDDHLFGVTITGTGDVWGWTPYSSNPVAHWEEGSVWRSIDAPAGGNQLALTGGRDGSLWLSGSSGLLARRIGQRWETIGAPRDLPYPGALWASARDDVWAAADSDTLRWNGSGLSSEQVPATDVAGSSRHDVWAFNQYGDQLRHFDGAGWSTHSAEVAAPALADGGTNPPLQFTRLWAASPTLAWGVGCTSTGAEWDGARWNARALPAGFCTLHGSSGKNVWALALPTAPSKDSAVYQFDGVNWLQRPGPTGQLWGVWALSPQDVWVSGGGDLAARFWHWTGSTWTLDEVPCPGGVDCAPDSIWARASNDVWAAADYALFHWNGTQWSAEVSPGLRVRSFVGADNELWLATSSGLLHKIR